MKKEDLETVHWTYEDYKNFPDDGKTYQLIRGEKFVTPAPKPKHQLVCGRIEFAIRKFLEENPIGECYDAPIDALLAHDTVVRPDIAFISRERMEIVGENYLSAAPDWVIEVLSPSTRRIDRDKKRVLYGEFGVREYWIVDPENERVEVFLLEGEELVKTADLGREDEARSLRFLPELSFPLAKVFA